MASKSRLRKIGGGAWTGRPSRPGDAIALRELHEKLQRIRAMQRRCYDQHKALHLRLRRTEPESFAAYVGRRQYWAAVDARRENR